MHPLRPRYDRRLSKEPDLTGGSRLAVRGAILSKSTARSFTASILCLLAAESSRAQAPIRVGSQFAVNTFTSGDQHDSQVASTPSGEFVVVWTSTGPDGSNYDVFARRFNAAGAAQAGEFQVASYTQGKQSRPAVDRDNAGNFVIAWSSYGQDGVGGSGIFARRFNAAGMAQGVEFRVNSYTPGAQNFPAVGMDADGDFVVTWHSENQDGAGTTGVFARRFNALGAPQGAELQVNSYTPGNQTRPAVDLETNGDFVIVWHSDQDASTFGVFGKRFSSSGVSQGPEFQVNIYQTDAQDYAAVGTDADGDFIVAWRSFLQDGSFGSIFARRYDSLGVPQSGELAVNLVTADEQHHPSIATDEDGDFVITWENFQQDGSAYGVFARRFKASGAPQGGDLLVNTFTTGDQGAPAIATEADGDFVVAWQSSLLDGSFGGIFAQRFDVPIPIDVDGDGSYLPLTDGLLLLRFGFGFAGATLVNGAVGPGCTRCDPATIGLYLKSLL